jgi:cytochrome c biogenesis protein
MKSLTKILLSRTTALSLIGLVGALCLIGVTVPQLADVSPAAAAAWTDSHPRLAAVIDALHFNRMYSSPVFLSAVMLLLGVMTTSMAVLFRMLRRTGGRGRRGISPAKFQETISFPAGGVASVGSVLEEARRRGYAVAGSDDGSWMLRKNRFSRWGTLVLHAGMIIVILAGVLTSALQKRGFVQLLERDTFFGRTGGFLTADAGALAGPFTPDVYVSLAEFSPRYYPDGSIEALESSLLIGKGAEPPAAAALVMNHPVEIGGVTVYQSTSFGYTIGLTLERRGVTEPGFFSLDHPGVPGRPYAGSSDVPGTGYVYTMELLPDPVHGTFQLEQPTLHLTVQEGGAVRFFGTLKPGDRVPLDGGTLTFVDIRRWSGLIVVQDTFAALAFLGFSLILAGLIGIYLLPERSIALTCRLVENTVELTFNGAARRERALFAEEFRDFVTSVYLKEGGVRVGSALVEI